MADICCCGGKVDSLTFFYFIVILDVLGGLSTIIMPILAIFALVMYMNPETRNHSVINIYAIVKLVFAYIGIVVYIIMIIAYTGMAIAATSQDKNAAALFVVPVVLLICSPMVYWGLHLAKELYKIAQEGRQPQVQGDVRVQLS